MGEGHPREPAGKMKSRTLVLVATMRRPLEAAPSVKQLDGLTCAMKVPTSAGNHPGIFPHPRRPEGTPRQLGVSVAHGGALRAVSVTGCWRGVVGCLAAAVDALAVAGCGGPIWVAIGRRFGIGRGPVSAVPGVVVESPSAVGC